MQNLTPVLSAVGIYAALNMAILLWIAFETGRLRGKYKVSIGDGGVKHLVRIIRGHANAVENMPMFFVHAAHRRPDLGMPVLSGTRARRWCSPSAAALHAWHFIQEDAPGWQRGGGFGLSFLAQVVLLIGLLGHGLWMLAG
jgi:uncharacterized membrane protein YecN with MAPEG domain